MKSIISFFVLALSFTINAQDTIFTHSITATKSYLGQFGSATLQIRDANNDNAITNPLIVAEGLDTGLLAQSGSIGDSDYRTFRRSILESFSLDLRDLTLNNTPDDYDIIYVNWDNGTDYIQRNAYVLEAVIKWVNDNKTGSVQNVVLGQSMGGLVARYALRDMENNNLNHDTSLYISHDAPHQGAHIPPGLLYMARHLVDQFIETPLGNENIPVSDGSNVSFITIDQLLDAPAVNQMLNLSVNSSLAFHSTTHTTWQNELKAIGYPQQTRNIAISNASHCAETYNLPSNAALLRVDGSGNTSALTDLILFFTFTGPLVGDFFNDTVTFLLGFLPGKVELEADFDVNAYATSGSARIYNGRITYEKTLLWLLPIRRDITNRSVDRSSPLFYDNFPGGAVPEAINFNESDSFDSFFG